METTTNNGVISFIGSNMGEWKVLSINTILGQSIVVADKVSVIKRNSNTVYSENSKWELNAFISNLRYTSKEEKIELNQKSIGLGRPEFNYAALIPIKKSEDWWALAQDERRRIFEEDSHHIRTSAKYLSVISRQLHHCKDLGEEFDFLTWFEFSWELTYYFDEFCKILRETEEWKYVTPEIDIRLEKVISTNR